MLRCPICGKWLWGKNWGDHWILGECKKEAYEENKKIASRKNKKPKNSKQRVLLQLSYANIQ